MKYGAVKLFVHILLLHKGPKDGRNTACLFENSQILFIAGLFGQRRDIFSQAMQVLRHTVGNSVLKVSTVNSQQNRICPKKGVPVYGR